MKSYEYRVEGLLLVKCNEDTGEEVLDKNGEIQLYIYDDPDMVNEYQGSVFDDSEVKKLSKGD